MTAPAHPTPTADTRIETDALGAVEVPAERLWGAQTERARRNFAIGTERMPEPLIRALALVKRAAAEVNAELGGLDPTLAFAVAHAAQEVADGRHAGEFPLAVWQTGSATQTNMNMNEVVANRAIELLGGVRGAKSPVHPNDHVNRGQSSNDTIPTAIHVAVVSETRERLLPALAHLAGHLEAKRAAFDGLVKIGRTHLMDATPLTLGQEFSGYVAQVTNAARRIETALDDVSALAQGGTAVGTGLNAHPEFGARVAERLSDLTGHAFRPAANRFEALAAHDALVYFHGALDAAAQGLAKIAGDVRLMASGPRSGLGELRLPANEPGSSIMPGKVNPTQIEAVVQVAARVHGNQATVSYADAQGTFELNVMKPVIADAVLQSVRLLADVARSFADRAVAGLEADEARIAELVERSLMLVTALAPEIGYDAAAAIAKRAHETGTTLREAALASGLVDAETFDRVVVPARMTAPTGEVGSGG